MFKTASSHLPQDLFLGRNGELVGKDHATGSRAEEAPRARGLKAVTLALARSFAGIVLVSTTGSLTAVAQRTPLPDRLTTKGGAEVGLQVSHYHYNEPGVADFVGPRAGLAGEFTLTLRGIFLRADGRVSLASLRYDGSGIKDGVPDRIAEARLVVGKDLRAGVGLTISPYLGGGYRHLFNDLRGIINSGSQIYAGYRRYSRYRYVPIGVTARIAAGNRWVLLPTLEYDGLFRGTQTSMLSDVEVNRFDLSVRQRAGHGSRLGLMIQHGRLAVGPWIHYWDIAPSELATIGNITLGLEPANWTRELGLEGRVRF